MQCAMNFSAIIVVTQFHKLLMRVTCFRETFFLLNETFYFQCRYNIIFRVVFSSRRRITIYLI